MSAPLSPLLEAAAARLADGGNRPAAAAALARLLATGLPTRRDEDWRYLQLAPLAALAPEAGIEAPLPALPAPLDGELRLVFVDGQLATSLSSPETAWSGWRSDRSVAPLTAFGELAAAIAPAAVGLALPAGLQLAGPLHLLFLHTRAGATLSGATFALSLGRGTEATLVESHLSADGANGLATVALDLTLADGAALTHVKFQELGRGLSHLADTRVTTSRDARYKSVSLTGGALLSRDTLAVTVNGTGAHTELQALFLPGEGQTHDHHTALDQTQPDCTARQVYKSILRGNGHAIFNGKVFVRQAAQRTNADQSSKSLLLDKACRVDAKPQLEIFADDVRCTHGATVGQLDPAELFYLMSRAIPRSRAEELLLHGFAVDVLNELGQPALLERGLALLTRFSEA